MTIKLIESCIHQIHLLIIEGRGCSQSHLTWGERRGIIKLRSPVNHRADTERETVRSVQFKTDQLINWIGYGVVNVSIPQCKNTPLRAKSPHSKLNANLRKTTCILQVFSSKSTSSIKYSLCRKMFPVRAIIILLLLLLLMHWNSITVNYFIYCCII